MLNQDALDTLFHQARSHQGWQPRDISDELLRQLYDTLKWAPTAFNGSPARFVFVKSAEQRARLAACASPGNGPKIEVAPVTVIVAMDTAFYEKFPLLSPHVDGQAFFTGKTAMIDTFAMRNSSLQGGYLILAARALGLDCGPMSGFDEGKVNEAFFAGTTLKANFLCSLGYGVPEKLRPRAQRLPFEDACKIV
ncbi:malonic semialdehyde reductase [Pseudoduganella aquatica]|uniref:Putative NADH dehydrogenase/NAD(P)H nitroreductase GTP77_13935 n=1 Tax=Pseudoduganella aquatica TaxID=2660641 RepID=A0A7X4HBY6_9BURK|nr:malonic semialdehyde reductase [Pseudoduganella aquatica]MYN08436.1 malonic semialdehyde reductase [Pseudoduganella aquatica]